MNDIKEFLKQVRIEANNIKKHAEFYEIRRLNFNSLNPSSTEKCVYGQMTGNCYSSRANALIRQCAARVLTVSDINNGLSQADELNGAPYEITQRSRAREYHSPIEYFIYNGTTRFGYQPYEERKENNRRLIAYLRGETKTLRFKISSVKK